MKYNNVIKQWKISRYRAFIKYSTFRKQINLVRAFFYWIIGSTKINSKPALLRVEISRKCSVNCLLCLEKKEELFYPFNLFQILIDEFKKYIYLVSLYEIGEPLENENIIDYIKYANKNNIGTIISSNLSVVRDDTFWEELVVSGLDKLVVAIDGISAEIYNRYRINGDLKLVLENLNKIIYFKKRHDAKIYIEWQMIDFVWNKFEQENAKEFALKIGCNEFRKIQEVTAIRRNYKKSDFRRARNCVLPYFTFNVNAYNMIRPCTKIYNAPMIVGDLNKNSFNDIWNSNEFIEIRSKKKIKNRDGCRTCPE